MNYIILFLVFGVAFGAAYVFHGEELIKSAIATPGIIALLGIIYQIIKDEAKHQKELEKQSDEQVFQLGAMSHMANIAFDKHVEFCEEYMAKVNEAVKLLFIHGPTAKAIETANELYGIRQKHSAWLTIKIDTDLDLFESALRKIGAQTEFASTTRGDPAYAKMRAAYLKSSFEMFGNMMNIDGMKTADEYYAIDVIRDKIRNILGIESVVEMRTNIISKAKSILAKNT